MIFISLALALSTAFSGQKIGSRDVGDPLTCNLSILNLPGDISEQALGTFFSQWGDIATVKVSKDGKPN